MCQTTQMKYCRKEDDVFHHTVMMTNTNINTQEEFCFFCGHIQEEWVNVSFRWYFELYLKSVAPAPVHQQYFQ